MTIIQLFNIRALRFILDQFQELGIVKSFTILIF